MRVVITHITASSHLNLLVPIAWALKNEGHDVVIAAQPDIMEAVEKTGLTGVPVGEPNRLSQRLAELAPEETIHGSDYDITETRPEVLTYEYVRDSLSAWAELSLDVTVDESMYEGLVGFCRSWQPDLVVWDPLTYPGPVAATVCGAAHVRTTITLDHWMRMRELYLRMREERGDTEPDPVVEWISAKLARFGCAFDEAAVAGSATIDFMPSWMRLPTDQPRILTRYVPHNGPGELPAWVTHERTDKPRVCLTKGASFAEVMSGRSTYGVDDLFGVLAEMPVEVVLLMSASMLPEGTEIPDNVRLSGFVPLDPLLKTCDAIIHHGGPGTVATALANATPQLVIPHDVFDEAEVADAIAEQGVGLHLPPERLTPELLREELTKLLEDPVYQRNADSAAARIEDMPGPQEVVRELEGVVARHRSVSGDRPTDRPPRRRKDR